MEGMNTKSIIMSVVAVAVAVLVVVTCAIPIFASATETERTFKNTGLYYMENPTDTISVKYLGGSDWEIDGEPLIYIYSGATNIIVTDTLFIRNVGQVRGSIFQTWQSAELTIGDGTITGTAMIGGVSTSINISYTWIYVATNDNTPYIMTNNQTDTYIVEDSVIIGKGLTTIKDSDGKNQLVTTSVDVSDLTATVTTTIDAITISNIQLNVEEVDGYIGLYDFSSVTFDATWGEYTTACTYNIMIAPSEVTVEKAVHPTDIQITLISIIPILMVLGIILAAVGMFLRNRAGTR